MSRFSALLANPSRNTAAFGGVLLLLGLLLLGFTEHADRLRAMGEDALGGFVLTGSAAAPGPAADGKLVLAVGAPVVNAPARDAQFDVVADAPALVRKVEMFQWNETRFGGGRNYDQNWYDHPIDSSAFGNPDAHANPGTFPINAARFDSTGITVGGFKLAPELVHMIDGPEAFEPDLSHLPPNMAATFQVQDGTLVTSANAAHPQIGDLRISWMKIAPSDLTVFARDQDGTLVPVNDPSGDPIAQVLIGRHSLTDVLTDAPQPPRFKWARRVLAVLLAWAGVAMLLPGSRRRDRVLALAVAVAPLALLAAICWFDARMLAFVVLLVVAILAGVFAAWRWRNGDGAWQPH
ncbi:MAG TPA: TMEM43 family protein [Rhodanobacteraceae bacterium]|nr:TMEM43 family protein [Rhodanobacteraceae bacterium]